MKVSFLKPPIQFWNRGPDLSIHNTVRPGWDNTKNDSQHAIKKMLDRKIKGQVPIFPQKVVVNIIYRCNQEILFILVLLRHPFTFIVFRSRDTWI